MDPPVATHLDALERKRAAIWSNAQWNDHVASIARALAAWDVDALLSHGLCTLIDEPAAGRNRLPSVLVACESLEHARELSRRLDGWPVQSLAPRLERRGWGAVATDGRPLGPGCRLKAIVTESALRQWESIDVDFLVHAKAGYWPMNIPALSGRASDRAEPITIIDIADDRDQTATKESISRYESYRDAGWVSLQAPAWLRDGPSGSR